MLKLHYPQPVKVIAGILIGNETDPANAHRLMTGLWGRIDFTSPPFPFDMTDYYAGEMGPLLSRHFVTFEPLGNPDRLADLKHQANEIEETLVLAGNRTVNIDVGYLDLHKLVLASTKEGPRKIYLRDGIWADMTLHYAKGAFHSFPWTFPDFASGRYDGVFLRIRECYKIQLRQT